MFKLCIKPCVVHYLSLWNRKLFIYMTLCHSAVPHPTKYYPVVWFTTYSIRPCAVLLSCRCNIERSSFRHAGFTTDKKWRISDPVRVSASRLLYGCSLRNTFVLRYSWNSKEIRSFKFPWKWTMKCPGSRGLRMWTETRVHWLAMYWTRLFRILITHCTLLLLTHSEQSTLFIALRELETVHCHGKMLRSTISSSAS